MRNNGFTLIELMIVVSIVTVLCSIAVPKMSNLIDKSRDAQTLGNLGVLRSALTIYYADTEGRYPGFPTPFSQPAGYGSLLHDTLVPNYLSNIPQATPSAGGHRASSDVFLVWNMSGNLDNEPTSGHGWTYDANPFDNIKPNGFKGMFGTIRATCQHPDSKGQDWQGL